MPRLPPDMIIVRPFKVRSTRLTLSEAVSRGSEIGDLDEAAAGECAAKLEGHAIASTS